MIFHIQEVQSSKTMKNCFKEKIGKLFEGIIKAPLVPLSYEGFISNSITSEYSHRENLYLFLNIFLEGIFQASIVKQK